MQHFYFLSFKKIKGILFDNNNHAGDKWENNKSVCAEQPGLSRRGGWVSVHLPLLVLHHRLRVPFTLQQYQLKFFFFFKFQRIWNFKRTILKGTVFVFEWGVFELGLKGLSYYFEPRLEIFLRNSLETSLSWDIDIYHLKRVTAKLTYDPVSFKSDLLSIKSDPVSFKSDPVSFKSDPLSIKSDPTIIMSHIALN